MTILKAKQVALVHSVRYQRRSGQEYFERVELAADLDCVAAGSGHAHVVHDS